MSDESSAAAPANHAPRWQPLGVIDRRVLGVLAEKAKTTPDIYPMSLNAICTGCNQKSNRAPLMQLEPSEVEESLDRLRELHAVGLVEGYGRVAKYRHYLYEWLGVDKVELAVMTELLLRGDQTVGELRGRAARMEPIADLAALRPVLDSLKAKGLVVALTPEGRGHAVTHALHRPQELETLKTAYRGRLPAVLGGDEEVSPAAEAPAAVAGAVSVPAQAIAPRGVPAGDSIADMRRELAELHCQVTQLRSDLDEMRVAQHDAAQQLRSLKEALGG